MNYSVRCPQIIKKIKDEGFSGENNIYLKDLKFIKLEDDLHQFKCKVANATLYTWNAQTPFFLQGYDEKGLVWVNKEFGVLEDVRIPPLTIGEFFDAIRGEIDFNKVKYWRVVIQ